MSAWGRTAWHYTCVYDVHAVRIYIYIYIYIHVYIYIYIYVYIQQCMHVCMHVRTYACMFKQVLRWGAEPSATPRRAYDGTPTTIVILEC